MSISYSNYLLFINEILKKNVGNFLTSLVFCRHVSIPRVSLHPKVINFGDIDVGNPSEQLSVTLTNHGHKNAQFVVDLGRNDLEIIVNPMKGTIQVSGR